MSRPAPGLLLAVALLCGGCTDRGTAMSAAETLRRQAIELRARNEISRAEETLKQAVTLQGDATADQRAATADLLAELGALQSSAGRTDAAEQNYREALALATRDQRRAEVTINLRTQLAGLCYRRTNYQEAANLYHVILQQEEASLGTGHPDVLDTLSILGGLELKLQHLDVAEKLFRRQLIGVRKLHGAEKREVSSVLDNLAEVAERAGKHEDAKELRTEAARIRHKLCDEC